MLEKPMQLRLSDVIYAIIKRRMLIIILTAAGLVVGIILSIISYARGEISKEYVITSSIAVISRTEDGLFSSHNPNPDSTDIYLAQNMVDSVMYVMKSDKLINTAINRMGLIGITVNDIVNNLHMSQYNETQIIELTLYWRNAEEGVQILNAINSVSSSVLVDTLKIGSISVVNDPTARYRVGGNVNASLWVYMAVLGLAAGIGFSILLVLLQPTLVNPHDLERTFGLKVIGEIPSNPRYFKKGYNPLTEEFSRDCDNVIESFISAAHILHNQLGEDEHKCFYITSATKDEGKTSVAANLAVHLANLEHKVLLIDFDVRNPSLGSVFLQSMDYHSTLNALYRGETTEESAVIHLNGFLDLLPAILEKKELPLDDAMLKLVQNLSARYDYVMMDAAPIGLVADTMSLNRIAHNTLFVIRHDSTNLNDVAESLERLDKSGIRVGGCIVNNVKKFSFDSYPKQYHSSRFRKERKTIRKIG